MRTWYKVVNTLYNNYNSKYDYEIIKITDDLDHSRDWNYHQTEKEAREQMQELLYSNLID